MGRLVGLGLAPGGTNRCLNTALLYHRPGNSGSGRHTEEEEDEEEEEEEEVYCAETTRLGASEHRSSLALNCSSSSRILFPWAEAGDDTTRRRRR